MRRLVLAAGAVPACVLLAGVHAACTNARGGAPPADVSAARDSSLAAQVAGVERGIIRHSAAGTDSGPPTTLAARMAELRVPGVGVAVFDAGRVLWARGYGVRDVAAGARADARVDTATLFQAASISKPVAAVGMWRLAERGRVQPDADVNTMLRSWRVPPSPFTATEPVTLRHIVSHMAGLTVHGFLGYPVGAPLPSLVQIVDGRPPANSAPVRVHSVPGARESYSGGGVTVMQLLLEDVTRTPFAVLMDTLVLRPAGMGHSTFAQPLPDSLAGRAASGYRGDGTPVPGRWRVHPEQAAAGLWTTPADLARFLLAVGRSYRAEPGGLLTPATARRMLTRVPRGSGLGFGLSGSGATLRYRHSGGNDGFTGFAVAFAETGRGVVVLTNSDNGTALYPEVLDAVSRAYGWPRMTNRAP